MNKIFIDYENVYNEIENIRKKTINNLNYDDFKHLKKIEIWGKLCTITGYLTATLIPNIFSAFLISQGIITRWAMITHHISHKGYDRIKNIPQKYNSKNFAKGYRRFLDWNDWIYPEAWNYEHNILHHYYTGELKDPDLVENVTKLMREIKVSNVLKYLVIFFFMCTWKFTYYAPNTLYHYKLKRGQNLKFNKLANYLKDNIYPGLGIIFSKHIVDLLLKSYIPYISIRFVLIPLLFLPLGVNYYINVLLTSFLAEIITNIHSFIIIVPNHSGEDIHRFDKSVSDKSEFYIRQIIGSVNYTGGNDFKDFLQGWLNYQIEHHVFPEMPMSKYREISNDLENICKKYSLPYIKENVFKRFIRMLNIAIGKKSMIRSYTLARNERI